MPWLRFQETRPTDFDPGSLTRLLERGRTVGAYPSFPGVLNVFVLSFPPPAAAALRLYQPSVAEAMLDAVVLAWEPDWATWTSYALHKVQGVAPREPVVGWLTYLASPVSADLPDASSRSLLSSSVLRIGHDVTDATEQPVVELRARLTKVGALRATP